MNARGNIDHSAARSTRKQGHDKRDEIWMSLIACGSIHQGHERFILVTTLEEESFVPAMQHGCRAKPLLTIMRFDMTFDDTLRDGSSFGKLTNSLY